MREDTVVDDNIVVGERDIIGERNVAAVQSTEHNAPEAVNTILEHRCVGCRRIASEGSGETINIHIVAREVVVHLVCDVVPVTVEIEVVLIEPATVVRGVRTELAECCAASIIVRIGSVTAYTSKALDIEHVGVLV